MTLNGILEAAVGQALLGAVIAVGYLVVQVYQIGKTLVRVARTNKIKVTCEPK